MSDLISRSALLKALSEAEDNYRAEHHDCVMNDDPFSDGILSAMFSVFQIVKSQPTAYSVDKVVEELESELEKGNIAIDLGEFRLFEIVKKGGVSDDVCEWKIFNNSLTEEPQWVYETTCGKYVEEEHTSKAFVYCPYCSKKIKVVE